MAYCLWNPVFYILSSVCTITISSMRIKSLRFTRGLSFTGCGDRCSCAVSGNAFTGAGVVSGSVSVLCFCCISFLHDLFSFAAIILHMMMFIITNAAAAAAITINSYFVIAAPLISIFCPEHYRRNIVLFLSAFDRFYKLS